MSPSEPIAPNVAFVDGQWHHLQLAPDGSVLVDGVRYVSSVEDAVRKERERIAAGVRAVPPWDDYEGWSAVDREKVLAVVEGGGDSRIRTDE